MKALLIFPEDCSDEENDETSSNIEFSNRDEESDEHSLLLYSKLVRNWL